MILLEKVQISWIQTVALLLWLWVFLILQSKSSWFHDRNLQLYELHFFYIIIIFYSLRRDNAHLDSRENYECLFLPWPLVFIYKRSSTWNLRSLLIRSSQSSPSSGRKRLHIWWVDQSGGASPAILWCIWGRRRSSVAGTCCSAVPCCAMDGWVIPSIYVHTLLKHAVCRYFTYMLGQKPEKSHCVMLFSPSFRRVCCCQRRSGEVCVRVGAGSWASRVSRTLASRMGRHLQNKRPGRGRDFLFEALFSPKDTYTKIKANIRLFNEL